MVPLGLQEASKMVLERSWGLKSPWQSFLWQRAWFVTQPQASRSLPIRSQNSPKIDHQSTLLNQLKTSSVLERFWGVLDTHFEVFFKYLRAKMISNSDKNTKMKILQNTCVFTVKMHFRDLKNIRTTLKKPYYLYTKRLQNKEANLTLHWTSKSVSQAGPKQVWEHQKTISRRTVKLYIKKYAKKVTREKNRVDGHPLEPALETSNRAPPTHPQRIKHAPSGLRHGGGYLRYTFHPHVRKIASSTILRLLQFCTIWLRAVHVNAWW